MAVDDRCDKWVLFQRLGASNDSSKHQTVCCYWMAGRCNGYPCPYLQRELPGPPPHQNRPFISNGSWSRRPNQGVPEDPCFSGRRINPTWGRDCGGGSGSSRAQDGCAGNRVLSKIEKLCDHWLGGNCNNGDKYKFLHSSSVGDRFSSLTQLEGHQKVVSGISLPSGSDKLYTESKDDTLRIWGCQSGQVPDEAVTVCKDCHADFGPFLRKHHCRNCKNIFFDQCTHGGVALPADERAQPVRVCDECMAEVTHTPEAGKCESESMLESLPPEAEECKSESMLEFLPSELLVKIICHLRHDQLKAVFHVSKKTKNAVQEAKEFHFNYTTPVRSGAKEHPPITVESSRGDDGNGKGGSLQTPEAPMQGPRPPSRLEAIENLQFAVNLFPESTTDI